MQTVIHRAAAEGFEVGTDAYERGRPEYPTEAVNRLVDEMALRTGDGETAVELGAGTGKFTKILAAHTQADIIAVEPVQGMREKFSTLLPTIKILNGSAESIPLPDSSVDAVLVAQAFHWFNGEQALPEIRRVLKPGGHLGMIWNVRDETKAWVRALTDIIDPHENGAPRFKSGQWKRAFERTTLFTELRSASYYHFHLSTPEMVVDRVASISFISALPLVDREKVLGDVRNLLQTDLETRSQKTIPFPYRTDIFWCQRIR